MEGAGGGWGGGGEGGEGEAEGWVQAGWMGERGAVGVVARWVGEWVVARGEGEEGWV